MMWVILSWVMVASICYFIVKHVDNQPEENIDTQNKQSHSTVQSSTNVRGGNEWVNILLSWIYNNVPGAPEPLKEWIRSLNDAAKKVSSNKCGVIFEGFGDHRDDKQAPKIDNIRVEQGPRDHLTIRSNIHIPVLRLNLVSSQRTSDRLVVSNMKAVITDLRGEIECRVAMIANQTYVMSCFSGRPEMDVDLIYTDTNAQVFVPPPLVEECIRRCLLSAVTNINVSQLINTSVTEMDKSNDYPKMFDSMNRQTAKPNEPSWTSVTKEPLTKTNGAVAKSPEMFEKISIISNNALQPRSSQTNKLKVNLQSITGIDSHRTQNVHVVVEMDEPPQRFSSTLLRHPTSSLAETEHTFYLSPASEEILFEVYEDNENELDDKNFLGLSIVNFDEIRKSDKRLHDLKLQGRPYTNDVVSGELRVLFDFFFDPTAVNDGTLTDVVKIRDSKGTEFRETCITKRQTIDGQQYLNFNRPCNSSPEVVDAPNNVIIPSATTQITVKTVSHQLKEKPIIHSVTGSMENAVDPETQLILNKRFNAENTEAIKQLTDELKQVKNTQKPVNNAKTADDERQGRSKERKKHEGSRDRSFFGEMRDRLSGRFRRNHKRSKSADINSADIEEAVSLPPSRDPSRSRYIDYNKDTKYMETRSVGGRSGSSNKSLYQHSSLVLELEQDGRQNYLLIPPAVLSEPAASNLMKRGKKLHIYNDHTFVAVKIKGGVSCNVCENRIKASFSKQAYQCRDCKLVCHKSCHYKIDGFCSQSSISKLQIARDIDWAHFLSHYPLEEFISLDGI